MAKIYYTSPSQFNSFLEFLKVAYKIFSPFPKNAEDKKTDYYYQELKEAVLPVYNPYRALEPLKSFFTYPSEAVADYFSPGKNISDMVEDVVILGVKNCDLAAHKIQDFVFLEGVEVDSLYCLRREKTIIISSDCTDFKEVCHCLSWDILPHPEAGFDLNLSPLNEGYLVETGSQKAEDLINKCSKYFSLAKDTQVFSRRVKREALEERLKRQVLAQNLVPKDSVQRLMKDGYNLDTWKSFSLTCVECAGCNLICDTCHCFLLADEKGSSRNRKLRMWDSCLYANYARVAGGANPLKTRAARLRNRFMKKFDFFVDNLGMPACCGCGRCIEVCPGKIDIREVLKDLAAKLQYTNPKPQTNHNTLP
jgi:formate hydrogenlyase subunit 6/NADH:ubiquinone oxidoreductase subunit I